MNKSSNSNTEYICKMFARIPAMAVLDIIKNVLDYK